MSWMDFFIILGCCSLSILACRVIPLFALKGKELPSRVDEALGFIPPAAFSALVANDLLSPTLFDNGVWPAIIPFIASVLVVAVAHKTKSLLLCVVTGVGAFALLSALSSMVSFA